MSWYIPYIYPIKSPFKNGPLSRSTSWSPGGRWPKCKAPPRCRRAPNPGENPWWPDPPSHGKFWGIHGYPTFFLKAFHCDMEELMTLMGLMGLMMKLAQSFFLIVLKHLLCDDFTGLSLRHAPSFMAPIWIETGDISGYPPVCITLEDRSPRYCNV